MNGLFQEGVALQNAGHFEDALRLLQRVARELERADVTDASIYAAIGYAHLLLGDHPEALEFSKKALEIDPKFAKALVNASAACRLLNRLDEAYSYAEKAHELEPANAQPLGALASILISQGKVSSGLVRAAYAYSMDPNCLDAIAALAAGYSRIGDMEMAMPNYERFIARMPHNPGVSSGMLFTLHYKPGVTREELRNAHKNWGDRFGSKFKKYWPDHQNERTINRRLRIGYVSGDFRHHVVGYWTKHIVEGHNRDKFETFCFANNKEDDYSQHFKSAADHWIPILDLNDAEAARKIQDAKIDILVDLSGHTGGHRLLMMARKPAPIQATWCGYIDSTGLDAFDYVISDEVIAPPTEPSPFVEEPLRLPYSSVCFDAIPNAPEVGPLPCLSKGHITFGCFNNPSKIGPAVVSAWAEILGGIPDSKLMLSYSNLADAFTKERLLRLFRDAGISDDRIQMRHGKREAVLQAYNSEIDIAFDTFPYNGGTTTCEALWMGVPVVGLYGGHPMSRFGCSLLVYGGLPALATTSQQEYIERAIHLASDVGTLSHLRRELRSHLVSTPLFNPKLFIEGLENAYIRIFERWCQER
jgi:predicted O-linked N-acetylglucosamine transferase (SPINDLY family)